MGPRPGQANSGANMLAQVVNIISPFSISCSGMRMRIWFIMNGLRQQEVRLKKPHATA